MFRKIAAPLLILALLLFAVSTGFAVMKGLESSKQPSLVKVGESAVVPEGAEVESAVSIGGSVTVYGHVLEDVVAVGGSVYLKDSATVGGDVVSVGGKVMKEPGAIAKGDTVEVAISGITPMVSFLTKGSILEGMALFSFFSFVSIVVLTIILVAIFTPQLGRISSVMEGNIGRNFWIGLLITILFVPIIVLLAVSVIGIIFIPVWVILFVAAACFGYIASAHLLGKKTLLAFKIYGKSMMIETLVGVILLFIVWMVPFLGFLAKSLAVIFGLGGVYQTRFGKR